MTTSPSLVNLELASKAYGERVLLDGVSLGISAGQRIGVVGRNGAGKTTLLAALAGLAELDAGRATRTTGVTVGYLPQAEELAGTAGQLVFGSVLPWGGDPPGPPRMTPEHEWAADPRSRSVITSLLADVDLSADVAKLSGGERRRTALAALLRGGSDLLLLDEPTNHLDIEAITWLAGYLREHARSYVVVTHDRWFLDEVTDATWEVAGGAVHGYEGGYSAYVLAKAERTRLAEAADLRRRNLLRKELAWLRRGPPARTSKPKFRIAAANALIAGEPPARDTVELARLASARLGKTVLELDDVSLQAGDRTLLDHVSWQLGPGERVGIVGVNGSGKTSLLRLLAGQLPAEPGISKSGQVSTGSTVRLGHLTQEPAGLNPRLRTLEAAEQVRQVATVGKHDWSVSQLLERLGLGGERQWTLVGDLSGGERRRLQLLLVLLAEPNVLLLDEPTNDLDIDTLTELEDMLDGWPGSAVVVSHDRYFLERITDKVLALIGGKLAFLPGGVDEYLLRLQQARLASLEPARPQPAAEPDVQRGGPGGSVPQGNTVSAADRRAGQKELTRLERQIGRLTKIEAELAEALAGNASDYARLVELGDQLRAAQHERAVLEERWLELAEDIS